MIERVNGNSNVGSIRIGLDSDIKWNDEILELMINRYTSVYDICIYDWND